MNRSRLATSSLRWVLGVLLPVLASNAVLADSDPKAKALLESIIKAHRALPAYVDRGEFLLAMTVQGKLNKESIPISVAFVRPSKIRIETPLSTLVSDGKTLTTSLKPLKKFTVSPAPRLLNFDTLFTEGPVGSAIFGGPGGPPMLILLNLLLANDPLKTISNLGEEMKLAPDIIIDGKTANVLRIESKKEPAFEIVVDSETKLLRSVAIVFDSKDLNQTLPQGEIFEIETFKWTPGAVETKIPDDSTFVYKVPEDFKKVDELTEEEAHAGAAAPSKLEALIGNPSPDFSFVILDGKETTKSISKADLAGKIVLIDFWATWCGPCLMELPEVQQLIEGLVKEKKEVVVIALSQDEGDPNLKEVRKLVEQTLSDKKIVLTGNEIGRIGLDPTGKVGGIFQVAGLPSIVVLDGKGIVRAAHVGFDPKIGEVLREEIDALLPARPK